MNNIAFNKPKLRMIETAVLMSQSGGFQLADTI